MDVYITENLLKEAIKVIPFKRELTEIEVNDFFYTMLYCGDLENAYNQHSPIYLASDFPGSVSSIAYAIDDFLISKNDNSELLDVDSCDYVTLYVDELIRLHKLSSL